MCARPTQNTSWTDKKKIYKMNEDGSGTLMGNDLLLRKNNIFSIHELNK